MYKAHWVDCIRNRSMDKTALTDCLCRVTKPSDPETGRLFCYTVKIAHAEQSCVFNHEYLNSTLGTSEVDMNVLSLWHRKHRMSPRHLFNLFTMEVFHMQAYLTQVKTKQCKKDSNIKKQCSCSRIISMVEKWSFDHWFWPQHTSIHKGLKSRCL